MLEIIKYKRRHTAKKATIARFLFAWFGSGAGLDASAESPYANETAPELGVLTRDDGIIEYPMHPNTPKTATSFKLSFDENEGFSSLL